MTTLQPAAVLWDMDGTIVDTEPYWMRAETGLIESYGGTWTHDDGLSLVGQSLWHSARLIRARGVDLTEAQIIETLTARVKEQIAVHVPWRPGAVELITELREAGVPTGLVTMSIRSMAELVTDAFDFTAFDVIVAGDEVTHGKPHPEAYLRGADLLGVEIAHCVAFEDSLPGLAAAVASGAVSIGVPHMVPIGESDHHTIWPTLVGRTLTDISGVYTAGRGTKR